MSSVASEFSQDETERVPPLHRVGFETGERAVFKTARDRDGVVYCNFTLLTRAGFNWASAPEPAASDCKRQTSGKFGSII